MKRRHVRTESLPGTRTPPSIRADHGRWWQPGVIVLVTLLGAAWFLFAEREIAGAWGFSLDDAWIYATYAKNLATGKGYVFNAGEHVAGATGPLYVLLLTLFHLIFRDVVLPAKALGIICLAASGVVVFHSVRHVLPRSKVAPFVAGVLVAGSPLLLWGAVSGMEIPVYLLLTCLGIYFYVQERWTPAVLCWSLGVWLRPDGLFLALLGLLVRPNVTPRNSIAPSLAFTFTVGTYLIFNQVVGGWILPSSVRVLAQPGGNFAAGRWTIAKQCADLWLGSVGVRPVSYHAAFLLPALIAGAILVLRRWPALVVYFVLFPVLLAASLPWAGQFDRYIVYTVPFGIILGVIGLERATERALGRRATAGLLVLGAIGLIWQGVAIRKVGTSHGWNVQNIEGMQRFIADKTRAATSPGDTIAVNDVGAMGYFSDCYVVDLMGLVSPKLPFPENLRRYRPKYMIVFPDWFKKFATIDWRTNQVIFYDADSTYKYSPFLAVRLRKNTISARNTMYLYERLGRNETGASNVPMIVH